MKRADQHEVAVQSVNSDTYKPRNVAQPDEAGIDAPCEKEIPVPEQTQTPSMGALPVDTPGSSNKLKDKKNIGEGNDSEIIATGSGADPEHYVD